MPSLFVGLRFPFAQGLYSDNKSLDFLFFSILWKLFYKMQWKKRKSCHSYKCKSGGRRGEEIQTLLLWLWELSLLPAPACADKKVKTSRNGKYESVVSGREAAWRHVPHLVWRPLPVVRPVHPTSLLQHLALQDRKSIRGQEMVRTELDFNLLSPVFNNPWCC